MKRTKIDIMALVMLPCDLPWWPSVVKQLDQAAAATNSQQLLEAMYRLHDMCNISLDPEEDVQDPNLFAELARFLDEDFTSGEREQFFTKTIPKVVQHAKSLKSTKPPEGLHFSLQQQTDSAEYSYNFVSSLIANAFFSTYPKRTRKTHPTLQDFNFTNFFKYLHMNSQKAKLRSIFAYFNFLSEDTSLDGQLIISRQVMSSKQWLTIEDWLESSIPLCPLTIRHEGRVERAEAHLLHVCFTSSRLGGGVLSSEITQESIQMATHPELLAALLSVEALEDNEVLIIEGARNISRIIDPKHRSTFESIPKPKTVTICCMDAEDYSTLPLAQYEEDNVLREMNKSLLGFRQRHVPISPTNPVKLEPDPGARRLSPIGESFSSTPPEAEEKSIATINYNIKASTKEINGSDGVEMRTKPNGKSVESLSPAKTTGCSNKRGRFIVLGSSGEVLPVTRKSLGQVSVYSSCNSQSTDSFHSAKESVDEDQDEEQKLTRLYSAQLDSFERRGTFAQRLKDALRRESTATGTTSSISSAGSSYAVGISVTGSHVGDPDIKVRRGGSRGFVLRDDTVDEEFLKESLEAEQKWLGRFKQSQHPMLQRRDTNASSKYSFSTEYSSEFSSELEEVYEQLSKWLEDPIVADESRELDARDRAVVRFAGSLLKRALSESFAGVPVQEGEPQALIGTEEVQERHKLALAVRSLSLELARHKHKRQHSVPEGEYKNYEDALSEDPAVARDVKSTQRRNLWVISFTSEVRQTLTDDVATISLPQGLPLTDTETITTITQDNKWSKSFAELLPHNFPRVAIAKEDKRMLHWSELATSIADVSQESSPQAGGLLPVVTGNWGCGSRLKGDHQLKLAIQWLAASLAGVPRLIYYTSGHPSLSKLDTVSRVLVDRHWTVGDLATAVMRFAVKTIEERIEGRNSLFEELIGMDKPSP
ncbi:uncharacterized protein LOC105689719 isoform X2 [Athalia rosae]|uniref:uncharacterized protein LOC105689719 isoform X2 n=1 Tax=Athalia rosae TaxID=37344 RepID=UPI002034877C|nr:uncharacterized protein LOC105689719 isoform X2 [Athalia rosae]